MNTGDAALHQQQFLEVLDRDEAERRFRAALDWQPLGTERVSLEWAWGRILARDVLAPIDVPPFDRANVDGFAVRADDLIGASERTPRRLSRHASAIVAGAPTHTALAQHAAMPIATGGMVPRGADAVVMIEHTDIDGEEVVLYRSVATGQGISFAGSDIGAGETVLRRGVRLSSRETGVLAALGYQHVDVWRQPRVAILSTGNELQSPGTALTPGNIYDSNGRILADAVRELGAIPVCLGIVDDHESRLAETLDQALEQADVVLLSGGTSKGAGDVSYRVLQRWSDPGVVVHGVALKPGKPLCLAVTRGKPVALLPGFPTSAVFTFHEFIAPLIRRLAGDTEETPVQVTARVPVKINSEIGRTEYLLVRLIDAAPDSTHARDLVAYPIGKGSGSVTTFSHADGFLKIDRHEEIIEPDSRVQVQLLTHPLRVADLVFAGSHCIGVDYLLGLLQDRGWQTQYLHVGSTAGLHAALREECDVAGIHLLDPVSQTYNRPFVAPNLQLVRGYARAQGFIYRANDERFANRSVQDALATALSDPECVMINRNAGSGTRILIDQWLQGLQPPGYPVQPSSHNAVAAAVAQGRADWGVAIERVAQPLGLGFIPIANEDYDFVVPFSRAHRPAVVDLLRLLDDPHVEAALTHLGLIRSTPGTVPTRQNT